MKESKTYLSAFEESIVLDDLVAQISRLPDSAIDKIDPTGDHALQIDAIKNAKDDREEIKTILIAAPESLRNKLEQYFTNKTK